MKRILIAILLAVLLVASSFGVVSAKSDKATPQPEIEKVVFIHYKAPAKPPWAGGGGKEEEGYKLFRGGVKWSDSDVPVDYLINTNSLPVNVNGNDAFNEIVAAFEAWDAQTSRELFNNVVEPTSLVGANNDGFNVISWVNLGSSNIIAITTFWFNVATKMLTEFDIEFNTFYSWGIDEDGEGTNYVLTGAMDIRNIATHESGHTLVLNDLYQSQYTQMTMYGYSDYGEVNKRSLEPGDIDGVHALYGN